MQCSVPNWKIDICTPLRVEKYNLQIKIKKNGTQKFSK